MTQKVLDDYRDLIRNTKRDLEDHLKEMNSKLGHFTPSADTLPQLTISDAQRFHNERDATEKCLEICEQVQTYINSVQLQPLPSDNQTHGSTAVLSSKQVTLAHLMTLMTLKECADKLSDRLSYLHFHGEDIARRLEAGNTRTQPQPVTEESTESKGELLDEKESAKQCLAICSEASKRTVSPGVHVLEDISVGSHGQQILISTLDQLFEARHVTLGDGAIQMILSSSDKSLQEFVKTAM